VVKNKIFLSTMVSSVLAISFLTGCGAATGADLNKTKDVNVTSDVKNVDVDFENAKTAYVSKDFPSYMKNLEKSAKSNNPQAQYTFGLECIEGEYTKKDEKKGKEWISKAAEKKYQPAINYLDTMKGGDVNATN
jgi:TPR repeat protein